MGEGTLIISERERIIKEIEQSRQKLYGLINISSDFTNEEIIIQSQRLDRLLNTYDKLECKYNKEK